MGVGVVGELETGSLYDVVVATEVPRTVTGTLLACCRLAPSSSFRNIESGNVVVTVHCGLIDPAGQRSAARCLFGSWASWVIDHTRGAGASAGM